MNPSPYPLAYRGRIAPSPTGFLHLGHACTFWVAFQRAREAKGKLILRIEDLDTARCREEFTQAAIEDLHWLGISWDEGPDLPSPHAPYTQSRRFDEYRKVLGQLIHTGAVYPCVCSRKDIAQAASAPHAADDEPIYPGTCRHRNHANTGANLNQVTWRFQVPDGEVLSFVDTAQQLQTAVAGKDFGDFVVWRRDDVPAYQLAVVADDFSMQITEVVRGEDLLISTFRQLLLYRALGWNPPAFHHTPLLNDPETGQRLAKRHKALSLRELRANGANPAELLHTALMW